MAAHKSNLNGSYTQRLWIMNVDNYRYTDADKAYVAKRNKN